MKIKFYKRRINLKEPAKIYLWQLPANTTADGQLISILFTHRFSIIRVMAASGSKSTVLNTVDGMVF